MNEKSQTASHYDKNDIVITVIYDNNPYDVNLATAWGFSAVITGTEKTILFDTGGDGALLLSNMAKLKIDPADTDIVVLSHIHSDHTGGLDSFIEKNPRITVYLLSSFPENFKHNVTQKAQRVVEVSKSVELCKDVFSTGQLGAEIKEQALVIRTGSGLVVITGCAHPGIVKILQEAKELFKDDIFFVTGGFHLAWSSVEQTEKMVSDFKKLSVRYVGPTHCTGDDARSVFESRFGKRYVKVGAGRVINLKQLQ